MGDEDDALPLRPQSPQDRQQLGDFARREIGGRLVEDHELRVAQHGFQDLDPLPAAERQVGDKRVRIETKSEAEALLADAPGHFASAQDAARLRPAEHDVLDHRHGVDQHEMLMDHRDAARHRVRRPVSDEFLAAKHDRARVRRDHAEQHLHQRALAGAVLAQEAEDLPGLEIKIDAVDRPDGAEAPGDPAHFEKDAHGSHEPRGASLMDGARRRRSGVTRRSAHLSPSARSSALRS